MEDLNKLLTRDAPLHFVYGAAAAQPIVAVVRALPLEYRVVVGLFTGFVLGVFKELYDERYRDSPFSPPDLAATTLGGLYSGLLG